MDSLVSEPICELVRTTNDSFRFQLSQGQERFFRIAYDILALAKEPVSLKCSVFIDGKECFSSLMANKCSKHKTYVVFGINNEGCFSITKAVGHQISQQQLTGWVCEYHYKLSSSLFLALLYLHGAKLLVSQTLKDDILSQVAKIVYGS